MIVKCIAKFGRDLPLDALVLRDGFDVEQEFRLIINKHYVVYGMILYSGYVWYYICDESYGYYPSWNPSPLFNVEDGRLSKYWLYSFEKGKNRDMSETRWAYPEWVNEPYYYDHLTDGDEREVKIFQKYKAHMDIEFPNPSITERATALDEEWLMCPLCIDAWRSLCKEGMVICPKCKHMLHNPRYENKKISLISDAVPN